MLLPSLAFRVLTVLLLATTIVTAAPKKPAAPPSFKCGQTPEERADNAHGNVGIISADPGCTTAKPARCQGTGATSEVVCKTSYEKCPVSSGCLDPNLPLRCVTGECVQHIAYCPIDKHRKNVAPKCPSDPFTGFVRCQDGICRPALACDCVQWSGCPFNKYQCPDGSCVSTMNYCGAMGFCDSRSPWSCGGFECVDNPTKCPSRVSDGAFPKKTVIFTPSNVLDQSVKDSDTTKMTLRNVVNFKTAITVKYLDDSFYGFELGPWWVKKAAPVTPKRILAQTTKKLNRRLQTVKPDAPATPVTPAAPTTPTTEKVNPATDFKTFNLKKRAKFDNPWDADKENYSKIALTKPVEFHVDYVGTSALSKTKIKLGNVDLWFLGQMLNATFKNGIFPISNGIYSTPVKVYTKGRMDDGEMFNDPIYIEFILNSELILDPATVNARKADIKLNEKYIKSLYCLAYLDGIEWRCINRNIQEINESNSSKNLADKRLSLGYQIPFPGTWAVIVSPVKSFLLDLRMKQEASSVSMDLNGVPGIASVGKVADSMNEYIGMIYMAIAMLTAAIFFSAQLREQAILSAQKVELVKYKKDLAITTDVDYQGQSVLNKLQENIRFLDNPMLYYEDSELEEAIRVNMEAELAAEEMVQKQGNSIKARSVFKSTKIEAAKQKAAGKKPGETPDDVEVKFNQNSLKKGSFAKYNHMHWRISGRSINGMNSIALVDMPEEGDVLGEENGGNTEAPVIQEEPEAEAVAEEEVAQEEVAENQEEQPHEDADLLG